MAGLILGYASLQHKGDFPGVNEARGSTASIIQTPPPGSANNRGWMSHPRSKAIQTP
jgi:hypothetical protein